MSLPLDMVTGLAAKLIGSISGRRSPVPRANAAQERHAKALLHPQGYNVPELSEDRVRVVMYRDEKGVKTSVFDSQIHCNPSLEDRGDKQEPLITKSLGDSSVRQCRSRSGGLTDSTASEGWRNRLSKTAPADSELLGEMMFGSMPMKVAGNTVKIHYVRSTDQLLLTKVFYLQRRAPAQCSLNTEVFVDSCPLPGQEGGGKTSYILSVTRPPEPPVVKSKRTQSLRMPSSASACPSLHSLPPHLSPSSPAYSPPSSHTLSISSSYTRRKNRSRATSLEVGSELYRKVLKPLDRPPRRGRKYAMGVIVTLNDMNHLHIKHFKDFIFSHFTLIDAHLERLKEGMEEALLTRVEPQRQNFLFRAAKVYQSFLGDLLSLYRSRRIHSPVWLGLVSQQSRRREICLQFTEELGSIIAEIDTKDTKHFFSTLLTAVLSHHLAWVYTVSRTNDTRHSRNSKSLAVLAESHPYNPLWAQLGDMFGAVTQPLKVTRTVITGQSYTLVCRLLYLLTYFIRCSEIQPGVVGTVETHTSSDAYQPISDAVPPKVPPSSTSSSSTGPHPHTTLEDSGDMFESRASSAVTMCPSPHTPAVVTGTPLVRTHPFSFRSPVPSTPELRSHDSSHDLHRHGSGSVDVSDTHSNWRSGSGSTASLTGSRTPRKAASESLDSTHSHHATPRRPGYGVNSSAGSWTSATSNTSNSNQGINKHRSSSSNVDVIPGAIRVQRDNEQAVGLGESPLASLSIPSYSPGKRFETSDTHSCASDIEQQFMTAEEDDIANSDSITLDDTDDVARLFPTATRKQKRERTWEYKRSPEMCASLASLESMGMCRVDNDHVVFDVTRNYAGENSPSTGDEEEGSPSRIESFDSLSDLAGNSNTFSRNGSSYSMITTGAMAHTSAHPPSFSSSLPHHHPSHPHTQHISHSHHHSPTHHCGSIDSGYSNDNSIDISSLTESSHTGVNDSLFTGPRFSIGLSAGHHCNPEHSNIFMRPSETFSPDSKTPVVQERLMQLHIETDDASLRNELEKTAMKRQESDASYVSSTAVRPPTARRSDTLDSSTTPLWPGGEGGSEVGEEEEGENGGTLTRRKRSGAFSYHGRSSHASAGDSSTLDSRESRSTTTTLEREGRSSEELRRLARERGRQVSSGRTDGEEDDVFGQVTKCGPLVCNDVMCGGDDVMLVAGEVPEVRVSSSSPPPLDSCWIAGCSDDEEELNNSTDTCPVDLPVSSPLLGVPDEVNVEESLSPLNLSVLKEQRSLLAERLRNTSLRTHAGLPSTPLIDFSELNMPSLEEFHLAEQDTEALTSDPLGGCSAHTHTQPVQDFGHSLFAGHSPTYLPDFVLHGTSEPLPSLQPRLERHLASMVKHSTVDEPVDHGVAIVADTDNWTCRLMVATRDSQTNDVDLTISPVKLSRYVRLMMASFRGLWEMRMPPDFCLSHLEDRLLELNERGLLLANNLMDHGNDVDLSEVLPATFKGLSIRDTDETLLLSLAGVHCPDPDLTSRLNYTTMRRTLTSRK